MLHYEPPSPPSSSSSLVLLISEAGPVPAGRTRVHRVLLGAGPSLAPRVTFLHCDFSKSGSSNDRCLGRCIVTIGPCHPLWPFQTSMEVSLTISDPCWVSNHFWHLKKELVIFSILPLFDNCGGTLKLIWVHAIICVYNLGDIGPWTWWEG